MTVDLGGESPSGKLIAATRVNCKVRRASDSLKEAVQRDLRDDVQKPDPRRDDPG